MPSYWSDFSSLQYDKHIAFFATVFVHYIADGFLGHMLEYMCFDFINMDAEVLE